MNRLFSVFSSELYKALFRIELRQINSLRTDEDFKTFQDTHLKRLILHCYDRVPYYHRVLDEIDIINDGDVDLSKFSEIPILTKEILRNNHKDLISSDYQTRRWYYSSSGGSTGEPVQFIQDDTYDRWGRAANWYYHNNFLGIDRIKCKEIRLWGNVRDIFQGGLGVRGKIQNLLMNTIILNSFRMDETSLEKYVEIINAEKPAYIRGYAGSLFELCNYIEKQQLSIHQPMIVASAAETLNSNMRGRIEKTFGIKLYDFYGSRETDNIAGECKEGLLHIFTFRNYVEVLDDNNRPITEGKEGRIIVTALHNYSMPFIRYEIGDLGVLGPKTCNCGSILPTLSKVTGRITDHFYLKNGTSIPAEFFIHLIGVVCYSEEIRQFQVIQEKYDQIRIRIVSKNDNRDYRNIDIENRIRQVMGSECNIIWDCVDEIPKTRSGKYLYTISKVR